ncbi:MAG: efflux RND transporter periplasmic adaptor subunit [Bacteroidota bacterium]|nr:efflux RND transporter periplasmic adaptor subunit [Bacteroidota bacterium]
MKTKYLLFILGIAVFNGCTSNKNDTDQNNGKFTLTANNKKMIKIDTVKMAPVMNELKLPGKVSFDEDKVIKIFPMVSGYVTKVNVSVGDYVEKGQVLAVIKSSEMASFENDMVNTQSNVEIAKKNLSAIEDMYKSGISSEREYITAQKEYQKAVSEMNKVKNIFKAYGGGENTDYVVKSPISGVLVEKFINQSMQIRADNNNSIFTISDIKNIWILANVYETDISKVKEGYDVNVTTLSYPDKIIKGKIDKIYNVLDPDNKTMKVRIQLNNTGNLLKPGMFANVSVIFQEDNKKMLSIPSNAIVFDRNKNYVLVYKSDNDIQLRAVSIESSINNISYISEGLNSNEKVISQNQLLLYNAMNN